MNKLNIIAILAQHVRVMHVHVCVCMCTHVCVCMHVYARMYSQHCSSNTSLLHELVQRFHRFSVTHQHYLIDSVQGTSHKYMMSFYLLAYWLKLFSFIARYFSTSCRRYGRPRGTTSDEGKLKRRGR